MSSTRESLRNEARSLRRAQVLLEDRDLAEHLEGDRLEAAIRDCVARTSAVSVGAWSPPAERSSKFGIGLLILEGLILRRVGVAGRFGAELLGEGDMLRPWQREDIGTSLPRTAGWRVLQPARIAVLDDEFALCVARYPEIVSMLLARAVRRSRHMAVAMAIVHQPRIEVRLHMLFWELADRWGRVRQDGVHVPVHLTHSTLAELVAARRPTVTKALGELAERDDVVWTGSDWLLSGSPPAELDRLGAVSVAG